MKSESARFLTGFPHARYIPEFNLITWHPLGVLDDKLVDEILAFVEVEERVVSVPPFNRYTDLSGLTEIRLKVGHMFAMAKMRESESHDLPSVKSAFYCDKVVGFGIARMYEALMKDSSILVRAFRKRAAAGEWLGVPQDVLSGDVSQGHT